MRLSAPFTLPATAKLLGGAVALSAATGAAFASWIDQGDGIFLSMVEAGLSWCF